MKEFEPLFGNMEAKLINLWLEIKPSISSPNERQFWDDKGKIDLYVLRNPNNINALIIKLYFCIKAGRDDCISDGLTVFNKLSRLSTEEQCQNILTTFAKFSNRKSSLTNFAERLFKQVSTDIFIAFAEQLIDYANYYSRGSQINRLDNLLIRAQNTKRASGKGSTRSVPDKRSGQLSFNMNDCTSETQESYYSLWSGPLFFTYTSSIETDDKKPVERVETPTNG